MVPDGPLDLSWADEKKSSTYFTVSRSSSCVFGFLHLSQGREDTEASCIERDMSL